jgi:hypothetical protein
VRVLASEAVPEESSRLAFLRWRIDTAMCRAVINTVRSSDAREAARRLRSDSVHARQERDDERRHELPRAG